MECSSEVPIPPAAVCIQLFEHVSLLGSAAEDLVEVEAVIFAAALVGLATLALICGLV